MKKISIIVPIYNVEAYLEECLNSIVNQTIGLKNLEVILINDGSTDNSFKIMKKFKRKYNDWILVNRDNKGISVTRNEGMDLATAKYITFLDSDDYLEPNALEELYKVSEKEKSDITVGKIDGFDSKGTYGYYFDKYIKSIQTFTLSQNKRFIKTISTCSKLYKRTFINKIRFVPGIKHEDNYFTVMAYINAKRITTVPIYCYKRRYREGEKNSIMQNLSITTFIDLVENYKEIFEKVKHNNLVVSFSIRSFSNYIISRLKVSNKKKGRKIIDEYLKNLHKNNNINLLEYLYYIVYYNGYYLFANLYYKLRW